MIIDAVELRRRYLLRIAGARDNAVFIGPEEIFFDITNACNLRCRFCITDHSPGNPDHSKKAEFFPWEKFLGLISDAVDLKVDRIKVSGFGEPTVHPLFRDMMRHLEHQPIKTVLVTNGTFPLDFCSDVLRGDQVLINLSAADRQQYIELKGKDFFDRVISNIKRLVTLRDTIKLGFDIKIRCVVNAANVGQKQKMQEMAEGLGLDPVDFVDMNMHEYNQEIGLPSSPMEDTVSRILREVFQSSDTAFGDYRDDENKAPPVCLNGWFYVLVMSSGHLSICYRIPHMRKGDLDKRSFKDFWLSPHMKEMRLLGKYGHIQKMYKVCQICPFHRENKNRTRSLVKARNMARSKVI